MQVRIATDAAANVRGRRARRPGFHRAKLDGAAAEADAALGGAIADVLAAGEIAGKPNELSLVHAKDQPYQRVAASIGFGERAKFTPDGLAQTSPEPPSAISASATSTSIAFALPARSKRSISRTPHRSIAEGAIAGTHRHDDIPHRTRQTDRHRRDHRCSPARSIATALETGVERGTSLGDAVNFARLMALTPGQRHDAHAYGRRAPKNVRARPGSISTCSTKRGCWPRGWARCSASRAARDEPATLSVHDATAATPIPARRARALVGKGITFDTGGISIKPAENMHEMKYDMSGGAGVIAAMYAIGKLKPKLNVIGLVPGKRKLARAARDEARRHPARDERQDDRGDQHRRRRPA